MASEVDEYCAEGSIAAPPQGSSAASPVEPVSIEQQALQAWYGKEVWTPGRNPPSMPQWFYAQFVANHSAAGQPDTSEQAADSASDGACELLAQDVQEAQGSAPLVSQDRTSSAQERLREPLTGGDPSAQSATSRTHVGEVKLPGQPNLRTGVDSGARSTELATSADSKTGEQDPLLVPEDAPQLRTHANEARQPMAHTREVTRTEPLPPTRPVNEPPSIPNTAAEPAVALTSEVHTDDGASSVAGTLGSFSAFDLTPAEPTHMYDRWLLNGTIAAGLIVAILVGVCALVACTSMPSAAIAFTSGVAFSDVHPDVILSSLLPAYCPESHSLASLPWSHPVTFIMAVLWLAWYLVALIDAGIFYALVDVVRLGWRVSCHVRPAVRWVCQKFRYATRLLIAAFMGFGLYFLLAAWTQGVDGTTIALSHSRAMRLQQTLDLGVFRDLEPTGWARGRRARGGHAPLRAPRGIT